jgi:hypothetical protein
VVSQYATQGVLMSFAKDSKGALKCYALALRVLLLLWGFWVLWGVMEIMGVVDAVY